jgi:hypothetical protein
VLNFSHLHRHSDDIQISSGRFSIPIRMNDNNSRTDNIDQMICSWRLRYLPRYMYGMQAPFHELMQGVSRTTLITTNTFQSFMERWRTTNSVWFPKLAARRKQLRYWPPFSLPDIGAFCDRIKQPTQRHQALQGTANIWQ